MREGGRSENICYQHQPHRACSALASSPPPCHTMKMETSLEGTAPGSFLPTFLTLRSCAATQLRTVKHTYSFPLLQFQFLFEESKTFRRMQKTLASGDAGCDKERKGSEVNFPWIRDSLLVFFLYLSSYGKKQANIHRTSLLLESLVLM